MRVRVRRVRVAAVEERAAQDLRLRAQRGVHEVTVREQKLRLRVRQQPQCVQHLGLRLRHDRKLLAHALQRRHLPLLQSVRSRIFCNTTNILVFDLKFVEYFRNLC